MKSIVIALLVSSALLAQTKSDPPIVLNASYNYNGSTLTPQLGPIAVAAHTKIGDPGSRFEMTIQVPEEGWITSFDHISLNGSPDTDPASLDLFVDVTTPDHTDLFCQGREERIVSYGHERPAWPHVDGFGYHVRAHQRLHVVVTLANPGAKAIGWDSLSVVLDFQPSSSGAFRRDAYPLWFDVKGCGESDFDLKPGTSIFSGTFKAPLDGQLVAVQPAFGKYVDNIRLENHTRNDLLVNVESHSDGSFPVQRPAEGIEWRLAQGDLVTIGATYHNPQKTDAKAAATGMALGLFVPTDGNALSNLEKKPAATDPPAAR